MFDFSVGQRVRLDIQQSQQIYNEGETAVFDCVATGNVGVTIRWKTKDGVRHIQFYYKEKVFFRCLML